MFDTKPLKDVLGWKGDRGSFPVEKRLEEILSTIESVGSDSTVIVNSSTGSGKTISLPWHIYNNGKILTGKSRIKVVVAMPTIVSVDKSYSTLAEKLEGTVYFAAGGAKNYRDKDKGILYATGRHLSNKFMNILASEQSMLTYADVIILDEYHTQQPDLLEIYYLWKAQPVSQRPILIKMSATGVSNETDDKIITVKERGDNEIKYIYKRDYSSIDEVVEAMAEEMAKVAKSTYEGNVIAFFPRVTDAIKAERLFKERVRPKKVKTLVAHSNMHPDDRDRLSYIGKRSNTFIFSTNLLESSVTVPGSNLVIDSMYENHVVHNDKGGLTSVVRLISQASAVQRSGRTGRTGNGTSVRMISERSFRKLDKVDSPKIEGVDSRISILRLIYAKVDPSKLFAENSTSKNPMREYEMKLGSLVAHNAVKASLMHSLVIEDNNFNHALTDLGIFAAKIGLDFREASSLYSALRYVRPSIKGTINIYGPVAAAAILSLSGMLLKNPTGTSSPPLSYDNVDVCIDELLKAHSRGINIDPSDYSKNNETLYLKSDAIAELLGTFRRIKNSINSKEYYCSVQDRNIIRGYVSLFMEDVLLMVNKDGNYIFTERLHVKPEKEDKFTFDYMLHGYPLTLRSVRGKVIPSGQLFKGKPEDAYVYKFTMRRTTLKGKTKDEFVGIQGYNSRETDKLDKNIERDPVVHTDDYRGDVLGAVLGNIDYTTVGVTMDLGPIINKVTPSIGTSSLKPVYKRKKKI